MYPLSTAKLYVFVHLLAPEVIGLMVFLGKLILYAGLLGLMHYLPSQMLRWRRSETIWKKWLQRRASRFVAYCRRIRWLALRWRNRGANKRLCSIWNIDWANDWVQLRELLNKVWDLGLLLLVVVWVVRINHICGFGLGGLTVLLVWCGDQVSFNTTVGGVGMSF